MEEAAPNLTGAAEIVTDPNDVSFQENQPQQQPHSHQ
jgi:hypothetical protein